MSDIVLVICLLPTAIALASVWLKITRQTAPVSSWQFDGLTAGTTTCLTIGFLYLLVATILGLTPWNGVLDSWALFRNSNRIFLANVALGLTGSAIALWHKGAARLPFVCAGLSLAWVSLPFFALLSIADMLISLAARRTICETILPRLE
jgi:hypothetical protein